jgi:ferric-dicitrate binding protein FerR (iron transport regulator)
MDRQDRIGYLLSQAFASRLSDTEKLELEEWLGQSSDNRRLFDEYVVGKGFREDLKIGYQFDKERVKNEVKNYWHQHSDGRRPTRIFPIRLLAAAAIFGGLLLASWFVFRMAPANPTTRQEASTAMPRHDIAPGRNRATLTLADNSVVELDSVKQTRIVSQDNVKVYMGNGGKVEYRSEPRHSIANVGESYNVLKTPIAGQYQIILPDGTHVWLNNASQLRYPVAFSGKERSVQLSGEAYFEVAPDKARPFMVQVSGQKVQVLGTAFNLSAYPEEKTIRTVLVSGSVKVSMGQSVVVLRPSEESVNEGARLLVRSANTRIATAWINGFFNFDNASAVEVFTQLARWYGIRVIYPDGIPSKRFDGRIDRENTFSQVAALLEKDGIYCEVEGVDVKVTERK